MAELQWTADPATGRTPTLRRPLLLMAFEGLFDAGSAATAALSWIREHTDSFPMATIDPENFFNFAEQRPLITLEDGKRVITWPSTEVWGCRTGAERDLVVMTGVEPHLQ